MSIFFMQICVMLDNTPTCVYAPQLVKSSGYLLKVLGTNSNVYFCVCIRLERGERVLHTSKQFSSTR